MNRRDSVSQFFNVFINASASFQASVKNVCSNVDIIMLYWTYQVATVWNFIDYQNLRLVKIATPRVTPFSIDV